MLVVRDEVERTLLLLIVVMSVQLVHQITEKVVRIGANVIGRATQNGQGLKVTTMGKEKD